MIISPRNRTDNKQSEPASVVIWTEDSSIIHSIINQGLRQIPGESSFKFLSSKLLRS